VADDEQRARLRRAFDGFKNIPFPTGSTGESDELGELHAELVQYDGHIAGLVTTLIGYARPSHPITFDEDLKARLHAAAQRGGQDAADARRYLDYLEHIRHLVELARPLQVAS
jgi:hypothetical protein